MTDGSADDSHRRHFWRIGRLVCSFTAVVELTTNADGIADFQWRLDTEGTTTLGVTHKTEKSGFHFVLAQCQTHHADGSLSEDESTVEIPDATLGRAEFRTCEVLNSQAVAHLTVVKHLVPST